MASTGLKMLGRGAGGVAFTVAGIVVEKYASKKFEELDHYAQQHGGYQKVAEDNLRAVNIQTQRAVFHAKRSLDETLRPAVEEIRSGSKKFLEGISGAVSTGMKKAGDFYYTYFPRSEELEKGGKYEFIGRGVQDPLLTVAKCENCLRFIEEAKEKIPENEPLKFRLLRDIRDSASHNVKNLEVFYQLCFRPDASNLDVLGTDLDSLDLATKYLSEPGIK